MKIVKEYKDFAEIQEDKIYKFSEYEPIKYNGNMLMNQVMEWLRAKLLEYPNSELITVKIEQFFNECSVNRDKFMTFYNEMKKTHVLNNFEIEIEGENISFKNFKKNN